MIDFFRSQWELLFSLALFGTLGLGLLNIHLVKQKSFERQGAKPSLLYRLYVSLLR